MKFSFALISQKKSIFLAWNTCISTSPWSILKRIEPRLYFISNYKINYKINNSSVYYSSETLSSLSSISTLTGSMKECLPLLETESNTTFYLRKTSFAF